MAVKVTSGFQILGTDSIDTRILLAKDEMKAVVDIRMPDKYFAVCKDDGQIYLYNKNETTIDPQLGKFRKLETTDTQYQIVDAGNGIWKLQSSTDGTTWTDVSTVDVNTFITSKIVDNLTSEDTDKVLSAKQGKVLNDTKVNLTDIISTKYKDETNNTTGEYNTRIKLLKAYTGTLEQDNPVFLNGEICFCISSDGSYKIKLGNGTTPYNELPFYEASLLKNLGIDVDSPSLNQILVYKGQEGKGWVNQTFFDERNISYDAENGISMKGYADASAGQAPVKDGTDDIKWINMVTTTQLDEKVRQAGDSATAAGSSASQASASAQLAEQYVEVIKNWIAQKFWWGTVEEYNTLSEIVEGGYYFVRED